MGSNLYPFVDGQVESLPETYHSSYSAWVPMASLSRRAVRKKCVVIEFLKADNISPSDIHRVTTVILRINGYSETLGGGGGEGGEIKLTDEEMRKSKSDKSHSLGGSVLKTRRGFYLKVITPHY